MPENFLRLAGSHAFHNPLGQFLDGLRRKVIPGGLIQVGEFSLSILSRNLQPRRNRLAKELLQRSWGNPLSTAWIPMRRLRRDHPRSPEKNLQPTQSPHYNRQSGQREATGQKKRLQGGSPTL